MSKINALTAVPFFDTLIKFNLSMFFRCGADETVRIYTSHESSVKFSMEAFKFIGQYDQVRMDKKTLKNDRQALLCCNNECVFWISSLGVHQLLHYHMSSRQSLHTLCSGLHQRHGHCTTLARSQKRSCHPDRKSLHLPGTPAAEEERITHWYVLTLPW